MRYLDALELSKRTVALLTKHGVTDEDTLRDLTREAFMLWPGAGPKTWQEIEPVKPGRFTHGMWSPAERPPGYRICSAPLRLTEKAVLVGYYGHKLWLPKRAVAFVDGRVTAPLGIIENAKNYAANRGADVGESAQDGHQTRPTTTDTGRE